MVIKEDGKGDKHHNHPIVERCPMWNNPCRPDVCDGYDTECPKHPVRLERQADLHTLFEMAGC